MTDRRRVAILGGGMGGMAAAWRLSEPGWEDRFESITVYQRGWRLGGKGASSRGVNGRIEEHGLHIWLGYYENSFSLVRQIYEELDRGNSDPDAPIRSWTDAFEPVSEVGFEDFDGTRWKHWVATFRPNDELPGDADAPSGRMTVAEFVARSLRLVSDFYLSLDQAPPRRGIALSLSPRPRSAGPTWRTMLGLAIPSLVAAATQVLSIIESEAKTAAGSLPWIDSLRPIIDRLHATVRDLTLGDDRARRLWSLFDLIITTTRGILADGLLVDPRGFDAINNEDYRDWIRRHGASPETLDSALVKGMYDLTFANQHGDASRPRFCAGTGLFLSGKLFFDYRGSIFWKMNAGMGDVLFAPMYEALRNRGVQFEFFHRVDALRLDDAGTKVAAIELGRQANAPDYQPLVKFGGLPCFPDKPVESLAGTTDDSLESFWSESPDAAAVTLEAGKDFDDVILSIPVGMHPFVCADLIESSGRWRSMVNGLGTTATKAFQVWLKENPTGIASDRRVTMTGYVEPFDTWSSMDHLLEHESWPEEDRPESLVYFCDTFQADTLANSSDQGFPKRLHEEVRELAVAFMNDQLVNVWPAARDQESGGFRWDLLAGAGPATGQERFDSQYWTANVDPSDRYVLSLPGSDEHRIRPDESGFDNLYLAGDWTDSGLNAGCVEAAAISGLQAANAVNGDGRWHAILGYYPRSRDD